VAERVLLLLMGARALTGIPMILAAKMAKIISPMSLTLVGMFTFGHDQCAFKGGNDEQKQS